MSLAMPKKRLFSEKPFFNSTQNSVKPKNLRLRGSATSAKAPFRGSLLSRSRHGRSHYGLPPASPFAVVRLLPETTGYPFRYPLRVAEQPLRANRVLRQQVVSERYSLEVSRNRPAKIWTQYAKLDRGNHSLRGRQRFDYRIHARIGGPAPNLAVDVSPVWPTCFVDPSFWILHHKGWEAESSLDVIGDKALSSADQLLFRVI